MPHPFSVWLSLGGGVSHRPHTTNHYHPPSAHQPLPPSLYTIPDNTLSSYLSPLPTSSYFTPRSFYPSPSTCHYSNYRLLQIAFPFLSQATTEGWPYHNYPGGNQYLHRPFLWTLVVLRDSPRCVSSNTPQCFEFSRPNYTSLISFPTPHHYTKEWNLAAKANRVAIF